MRRAKATLIYRRTKNLRAVQLLLGHSKLESTVRLARAASGQKRASSAKGPERRAARTGLLAHVPFQAAACHSAAKK